jgi:sigma-E factor negative regulatory protein RseC
MVNQIVHEGIVQKVLLDKVTVVIISASACSSCHAQGACLASDLKEKEIEVINFKGQFHPGQLVNIIGKESQRYHAVLLGYILPFLLVFFTLILSISITNRDGLSGILSIAILIPYYLSLFLFRDRIKHSFEFEIAAKN